MLLAFCGHQGSGKTYFGKIVAERLELPFYDVDAYLGGSPRELFKLLGHDEFRKREKEVILNIIEEEKGILALGGGSFTDEDVAHAIYETCFVVYLEQTYQNLYQRLQKHIENGICPAYLDAKDPYGSFDALYKKRSAQYERFCHAIIVCGKENIEEKAIDMYRARYEQ